MSKETITQKEIFDYLFEECKAVGERIKAQGTAKGHEYSSLLITFACMLRAQTSTSTTMYDFFRKAFNMPPNTTLCRYSNTDSTSPDGLMMQTIIQVSEVFMKLDIPVEDWRRYVNLGWDSHVIKDLLGMYHTICMSCCTCSYAHITYVYQCSQFSFLLSILPSFQKACRLCSGCIRYGCYCQGIPEKVHINARR